MSDRNKIKDNCFALPKGINWCPMDVALKTLEENLNTVCQKRKIFFLISMQKAFKKNKNDRTKQRNGKY